MDLGARGAPRDKMQFTSLYPRKALGVEGSWQYTKVTVGGLSLECQPRMSDVFFQCGPFQFLRYNALYYIILFIGKRDVLIAYTIHIE